MDRIKGLYEFKCQKTGDRWYREEAKIVCPIKGDCSKEIK